MQILSLEQSKYAKMQTGLQQCLEFYAQKMQMFLFRGSLTEPNVCVLANLECYNDKRNILPATCVVTSLSSDLLLCYPPAGFTRLFLSSRCFPVLKLVLN